MKWTLNQLQKYRSKEFPIDEMVNADEIMKIDSTIRQVCSRTLVDVNYPIHVDATETFLLKDIDYESQEEVHQVNGDVIDLMPIIHEILLLEVPIQVFCEDSTEEGAPQSGKDWEVVHDQDKKGKIDPRLAGLAKFFDQDDQSSET